jgi:hypothetical protein
MNVRDLQCWPPKWQGGDRAPTGERGTLIAIRWDVQKRERAQTVTLTMEAEGDRYSGVLEDELTSLAKLYLLLGSHVGRPLAKIGSLEIDVRR